MPIIIELQIATQPPYNLIAQITNASQAAAFFGSTLTIHGVPGAAPFLTLPRSCAPAADQLRSRPLGRPRRLGQRPRRPTPLTPSGCGKLGFSPTLSAQPTTNAATAPTGLDLSLDAPRPRHHLADRHRPRRPRRRHPQPAAADDDQPARSPPASPPAARPNSPRGADLRPRRGLPAGRQDRHRRPSPRRCSTNPVAGTIFVAEPDDPATAKPGAENPLDARFALYLVLRDAARGVLLTEPIELDPDPASGRLSATLDQLPQLPLSHLELRFNSGPHAPLTTPRLRQPTRSPTP